MAGQITSFDALTKNGIILGCLINVNLFPSSLTNVWGEGGGGVHPSPLLVPWGVCVSLNVRGLS